MSTGLAGRWLDVYYRQRVPITIDVERILVVARRRAAAASPSSTAAPSLGPAPPQSAAEERRTGARLVG